MKYKHETERTRGTVMKRFLQISVLGVTFIYLSGRGYTKMSIGLGSSEVNFKKVK